MAMANPMPRDERVAARLTRDQKRVIERAARLRGLSISDFLVSSAWEAARRTIEEEQVLRLSLEESARFVAALSAEPRPIEAIRAATARRRELVAD